MSTKCVWCGRKTRNKGRECTACRKALKKIRYDYYQKHGVFIR